MIDPRPIGKFLPTDEHGYIQPDVSSDLIAGQWRLPVAFAVESLMTTGKVEAIYLRGSVPRGLALDNISDIDFIYLAESGLNEVERVIQTVTKEQFPFVNGVEFLHLSKSALNRTTPPRKRPYFQMLLKTQSLFLAGNDVTRDIAPFQPGIEMVSHVFELSDEFSQLSRYLEESHTEADTTYATQWYAKRVVRSGLEITLNRSSLFSRDLFPCYKQFAAFYPARKTQMHSVLINCLNGHESPLAYGELVAFLASESSALL